VSANKFLELQRRFHRDFERIAAKLEEQPELHGQPELQDKLGALVVSALAGYLLASRAPRRARIRTLHHAQEIGKALGDAFAVTPNERAEPLPCDRPLDKGNKTIQ